MNMGRQETGPILGQYKPILHKWLPQAKIQALPHLDGLMTWKGPAGPVRYLIEEKRHLRHLDAQVVVEQLARLKAALPRNRANDRLMVLAPYIRPQQAAILERAGVDYVDLAGNAHLRAPGLFVHVEGRKPPKETAAGPGRPQKGWIKAVMALLVEPELTNVPYRTWAREADVALGTIAGCVNDLAARGLLLDGKAGRRVTDNQALVALWVQAYVEGLRPKLKERRFQLRATEKAEIWGRLQDVLKDHAQQWALTGADAADRDLQYFRAEETEIYAPIQLLDDRDVQKALAAQPTARGGNLLVIEPPGPLATAGPHDTGLPTAPNLLAYAELRYRATGQALEAAEQLLPKVLGNATH